MYVISKKLVIGILSAICVVSLSGQVLAQSSACGEQRGVKSAALDEGTWKSLNDIYEDIGEELYDSAYEKLLRMYGRARDDYQKAVIAQGLAQVEWSRENFDSALGYFDSC